MRAPAMVSIAIDAKRNATEPARIVHCAARPRRTPQPSVRPSGANMATADAALRGPVNWNSAAAAMTDASTAMRRPQRMTSSMMGSGASSTATGGARRPTAAMIAVRAARIAPSVRPRVGCRRVDDVITARSERPGRTRASRPLLPGVGQEGQFAGPLDRHRERPLVARTVPGDAPRQNLAALGHEPAQAVDLFVVDVGRLLSAERADLALGPPPVIAARPRFSVSGVGHSDPPWVARCLERDVLVGPALGGLVAAGGGGRRRLTRAGGGLCAVEEADPVRDDLGDLALLSVLGFVRPDLQPPLDGHHPALRQVLADLLRGLSPGHDVDEVGLPVALLILERPVHREREARHRRAARHVPKLRIPRQPADQDDAVIHRRPPLRPPELRRRLRPGSMAQAPVQRARGPVRLPWP